MSPNLGYVKIYFHENHVPEYLLFDGVPGFNVSFIGYTGEKIAGSGATFLNSSKYVYTEFRKLLPDSITDLLMRQPPSTVSFVELLGLDVRLDREDIIVTAELYSFISRQCANYCKRNINKRLVVEIWETIPTLPIHYLPSRFANVVATRDRADFFIAHSERAKAYLKQLKIKEEKMAVIYPGVDLEEFSPRKNRDHQPRRILFIGRYDREKGLLYLICAFKKLHKEFPDLELWIRAKKCTGEVLSLVEYAATKYPIKFIPFIKYSKLPELYRECDILCLPSFDLQKWGFKIWEEQFGFVLMEAMACGLPVVGTNCGSIPEVIGPQNPVVPQKSSNALFSAIRRILKDDNYWKSLSKANRARAERLFDIQKQKKKLGRLLKSL